MVYKSIYETLRAEIRSGLYDGAGKLPSENALKERFGVERLTVRRAIDMLTDEGLVVKRPGVGHILAAQAAKFGGRVKPPVKGAAQNRNILFVTLAEHGSGGAAERFHLSLSRAFEKRLSESGYNLVFKSLQSGDRLKEGIDGARPAAVIFDSFLREDMYADALFAKLPCISVNHYTPLMTSVVSNNADGAYAAAKTLLDAGHGRIAVVIGKRNYQTCLERMAGVQSIYAKRNKHLEEKYVVDGDWSFGSGVRAGGYILSLPAAERPSAVFAFNDDMAYGCRSALEKGGCKIPEDISLIGFDKSGRYDDIFPPVTTVDVNLDAMADCAAWYLLCRVQGAAPEIPVKIQIDTNLRDNGTVAPFVKK
jgi:LacI family transcriptional regulator